MAVVSQAEIEAASLEDAKVAVLGYGSQGRAQALNLRDSGIFVTVGLRSGSARRAAAQADGLPVLPPAEAAADSSVVAMLVPDEVQPRFYREKIEPALTPGSTLVFAHGFNIHYGRIEPRADLDVVLVAPSAIGEELRAQYLAGRGTAGLVAVAQDASGRARSRALAYARALGHDRAAIIDTSFAEETETDLFAEQTLLVGGLTGLIEDAFETLVAAGYQEEIAYFCCFEEVKFMADMLYAQGLAGLWRRISSTAAFGAVESGPRVVNPQSRAAMEAVLEDIRAGRFAARLASEMQAGAPALAARAARLRDHRLEALHRRFGPRPAAPGGGPRARDVAS
ncbi:MAG TPA: ketol-acid reductoisomerase [Gammaproteobacteria bacterium]|nr:ketol-acid reductoisomerase [Gammaproteobacteria bacterium]